MGNQTSAQKITPQDRAILDMKIQRDKLKTYQKRIQIVLDREKEVAQECLRNGQKDKALLALRKRKYQEQLFKKTDGHLETLEQLSSTIEFSLIQKDILFGLQQGNAVLKQIRKEMSLERVEKLMGETQDAIAYQREVSELLGSNMTNEDEDAVEDEFEILAKQAREEERLRLGLPPQEEEEEPVKELPTLPSAPEEEPVPQEDAEEEETREERVERSQALLAA